MDTTPIRRYLPQNSLDNLVRELLANDALHNSAEAAEKKIEKKSLDPILLAVETVVDGVDWRISTIAQTKRSFRSGVLGDFLEDLIGLVPGWDRLPEGGGDPDLVNKTRGLAIEHKARSNTTKGENLKDIYDKLLGCVNGAYRGYTGIYAYALVQKRQPPPGLQPFTPSDNKTRQRRPEDPRILQVDGLTLWDIMLNPDDPISGPYTRTHTMLDVYRQVIEAIFSQAGVNESGIESSLNDLLKSNFRL